MNISIYGTFFADTLRMKTKIIALNIFFFTTSIFITRTGHSLDVRLTKKICEEKQAFLEDSRKYKKSWEEALDHSVKPDTNLVYLGVEHYNFEDLIYSNLVSLLQERMPHLNCFFVESDYNPNSLQEEVMRKFNSGVQIPNFSKVMGEYSELYKEFRGKGIKVFHVDKWNWDVDEESFESEEAEIDWLNFRDSKMAENISELYNSGSCTGAIYPVGLAHIVESEGRKPLHKLLLQNKNISDVKVLLLVAGANSEQMGGTNPSWWWTQKLSTEDNSLAAPLCPMSPDIPKKPYAFLNEDSSVPIAYTNNNTKFWGTYGEFFSTLVYTCESEPECHQINEVLRRKRSLY